ncbi:MAG: AraC family transcriptional regulator, partial [Sneathiella sp.]
EFGAGTLFMIDEKRGPVAELYQNPHRHSFYEMIWVQAGQGSHNIDFIHHEFRPGRLYLIAPGQIHQWSESNIHCYMLTFSEALLDKAYREMLLQGANLFLARGSVSYIDLTGSVARRLQQLISLMQEEYERDQVDWNLIRPLISAFLYELARLDKQTDERLGHRHHGRVDHLTKLIETYYQEHNSVEFYASHLNITSKRLNEICRDMLGKSVSQMIHERLTLEAKRDLSLSQDSVKTISYRLGFQDPSYFGRFFLREVGQSPNSFRDDFQRLVP